MRRMNHPLYKTTWCDFHWRSHGCKYGDGCTHAHNIWEFRGSQQDEWRKWYLARWQDAAARWQDADARWEAADARGQAADARGQRWQPDDARGQDDDDEGHARWRGW